VDIYGRVGSLLEVGTGFHPELTGRENIFLNGAILGMTRREIMRKFDEIVAFAEIEKFLDTAVKFYSSGMYVRLAFAVAAHLEPEILVVDEVLAVGDAEFQKKCLGKMGDVAREGRTVLFVSHNMGAISQLCKTAILLESGFVKEFDQSSKVIGHYLTFSKENPASIDLNKYPFHQGNQKVKFEWGQVLNSEENVCENFSIGDDILVALSFKLIDSIQSIKLAVELRTSDGIRISNMIDSDSGFQIIEPKKLVRLLVTIKDVRLYPGTYSLSFWAGSKNSVDTYDYVEDCISFNIVDGGNRTMRSLPRSDGLLFLTPEWRLMPDDTSTAVHITTPTESL
jgi:lipopolysaccharide transport system ATP-binding protein